MTYLNVESVMQSEQRFDKFCNNTAVCLKPKYVLSLEGYHPPSPQI